MRNDFSVGGVVTDHDGRVALIRTINLRGETVWGLPKGHPKRSEPALVAAVREVQEETGLIVEALEASPASSIDYWFVARDGVRVHKRVDFYLMQATGGDTTLHDDEVEEVELLLPAEARARLTYDNERAVLDAALT